MAKKTPLAAIGLCMAVALSGCVSTIEYAQRDHSTVMVSVREKRETKKAWPVTSSYWNNVCACPLNPGPSDCIGPVSFVCGFPLTGIFLYPWFIFTGLVDLPAIETNLTTTIALHGKLLSKEGKPLARMRFSTDGLTKEEIQKTDVHGNFNLTSFNAFGESAWTGPAAWTLVFDELPDISSGTSVRFWSPIQVEFQISREGDHLELKRRDYVPRLVESSDPDVRDRLEAAWVDAAPTGTIVLTSKSAKSGKNMRITRKEEEANERRAEEEKRAEAEAARREARLAKMLWKRIIRNLSAKWPLAAGGKGLLKLQILSNSQNAVGNRLITDVKVLKRNMEVFLDPNIDSFGANMQTWADYAEQFDVACHCDGEVDVMVDLNYVGRGEITLGRFRVDPETGRGRFEGR